DALRLLRSAGYAPRVVIDCGANRGEWTQLARAAFPDSTFLLIEPQPACTAKLTALAARLPRVVVHAVAITEPGISRVRMIGGGEEGGGTGAWVGHGGGGRARRGRMSRHHPRRADRAARDALGPGPPHARHR